MYSETGLSMGEAAKGHAFEAFPEAKQLDWLPDELLEPVETAEIKAAKTALDLLSNEQQRRVRLLLEEDSNHGDPHTGRLEDWYVQLLGQSNLREMPYFMAYGRSSIDAIPRHDLVEVVTGDKNFHRQRGAMFSLVFDTLIESDYERYQKQKGITLTRDKWIRKKWATAFHILHHHPEGMPTTDEILARGYLIDIHKMNREAGNFGPVFEPYKTLGYLIPHILHEQQPEFSREEIDAIRAHAYLVAAADKMDQLTPIEISSNRTILLNPGRPMYVPHKRNESLKKEFAERITQGGQSECDDTLSRFLFEMCRTDAFVNAPEVVQRTYTMALRQKTQFLYNATIEFLNGNFEPFVQIYDDMELAAKDNILFGLGYQQKDRHSIMCHSDGRLRHDSSDRIRSILEVYRFEPRLLDATLETIEGERIGVTASLEDRYNLMHENGLLRGYHLQRIKDLLAMAVDTMEANVNPEWTGNVELPYVSYYHINWSRYKQRQFEM